MSVRLAKKIVNNGGHSHPDIDLGGSIWLARRYAKDLYHAQREPGFVVVPKGATFDELVDQGILPFDTAQGPTDNHTPEAFKRNVSSFDLTMEWLGITDPALTRLAKSIREWDVDGRRAAEDEDHVSLNAFIEMIQGWNMQYSDDPAKVITLIGQCLDGMYQREHSRITAVKDYQETAEWKELSYARGGKEDERRMIWACLVQSNEPTIAEVVRNRPHDTRWPDVIVIVRTDGKGRYQIIGNNHPDPRKQVRLDRVAMYLRIAELVKARRQSEIPKAPKKNEHRPDEYQRLNKQFYATWRQRGFHPLVSQWYLHQKPFLLLNGTDKHRSVPTSGLTPEQVFEMVCVGLNDTVPEGFSCTTLLPSKKELFCSPGCPFNAAQLPACRQRRFQLASKQGEGNVIPLPTTEANG